MYVRSFRAVDAPIRPHNVALGLATDLIHCLPIIGLLESRGYLRFVECGHSFGKFLPAR